MAGYPTLSDIENNIDKYAGKNLEEIMLIHPAIDCKFLLYFKDKINFDKLSELFMLYKSKGKLKSCGAELNTMCIRELGIDLEKK